MSDKKEQIREIQEKAFQDRLEVGIQLRAQFKNK